MKRIVIAAAALCALATAAPAADLPAKSKPSTFANLLTSYTGQGLYVGANMGGGGGSANVASANVVALQGLVGLTVGYAWTLSPTNFAAIEADFDVMNLSTGSNAGLTLNGPADFEQRFIYGFPMGNLSQLPVLGPIFTSIFGSNSTLPPFQALPPGVTATNTHMYLFAGVDEKDVSANLGLASSRAWLIAPEVGFGNRTQLSNGFALDTSLAAQFDSQGTCVGSPFGNMCGNIGTSYIGKLKLLY